MCHRIIQGSGLLSFDLLLMGVVHKCLLTQENKISSETSNHFENNANMEDMETVPHLTVKIVFEFRMFCCPISTGQRYLAVVLLLCFL